MRPTLLMRIGQEHRNALRQYVQILAGKAGVSGIDLGAADSPLVR